MITSSAPSATAIQGIQQGFERLANSTQTIANPNSPDVTQALIDNTQVATQVQTSAKALKTHDEMIGRLIDIMA